MAHLGFLLDTVHLHMGPIMILPHRAAETTVSVGDVQRLDLFKFLHVNAAALESIGPGIRVNLQNAQLALLSAIRGARPAYHYYRS